jgi:hypothetical protein
MIKTGTKRRKGGGDGKTSGSTKRKTVTYHGHDHDYYQPKIFEHQVIISKNISY